MIAFALAALLAATPCRPVVDVKGAGVPEAVVDDFRAVAADVVDDVHAVVGGDVCAPISVTLVPAMERANELDPPWHLPSWAAGAAQPFARRIVVGITAGRQVQARETTLKHELVHVLANDAAGRAEGRPPMPRWLDEGIARFVAGEHGVADHSALARARLADRFLPLGALEQGFPPGRVDAGLAYAEAGRAVSLVAATSDTAIARLLARLRAGDDVDAALVAVYGRAAWQLDKDMRQSVDGWAALAAVGVETDLAMAGCGVVVAFAGVRARRRIRERMAALDPPDPVGPEVALTRWRTRGGAVVPWTSTGRPW